MAGMLKKIGKAILRNSEVLSYSLSMNNGADYNMPLERVKKSEKK